MLTHQKDAIITNLELNKLIQTDSVKYGKTDKVLLNKKSLIINSTGETANEV